MKLSSPKFLPIFVIVFLPYASEGIILVRKHFKRTYDEDSGCEQSQPGCGSGSRVETTYEYHEVNGKCIREPVRREYDNSCTCVPVDSCKATESTTSTSNVDVNVGNGNVNVVVRRGKRSLDHFLDTIFRDFVPNVHVRVNRRPTIFGNRNVNVNVGGLNGVRVGVNRPGRGKRSLDHFLDTIFRDFVPNIDVRVNRRPTIFGNRDVNVNVGGPNGVRVGVNRPGRPFFSFGIGPEKPTGFYPGTWNTDTRNGDCLNCGGPGATRPTVRRRVVPPPSARCPSGQVCCRSSPATPSPPSTPPPDGSCGRRAACGVAPRKIVPKRGEANLGEYPWMAIVLKVLDNGKKEFLCNGALIDNQRVLTVAQCVENFERYPEQLDIRLGEYDLDKDNEPVSYEDFQVSSVRIHPRYDNISLINDIAIVTLNKRVRNDIHISPVCIPKERESFESRSCVTTGWGNRQPILKEFPVECIGDGDCSDRLRSSKLGPYYQLHQSFFCAQSRDSASSCTIDGGGPLVCRRKDGSSALIGLLSWSVDDYAPDVYVRVQHFLNFINGQTSTSEGPQTTTTVIRTTREAVITSTQEDTSPPSSSPSTSLEPSQPSEPQGNTVVPENQEIDQSQIDRKKHLPSPSTVLLARGLGA